MTGKASADSDVSLVTALRDQLGLKLDRARRSMQVVVIDGVEPPTEN